MTAVLISPHRMTASHTDSSLLESFERILSGSDLHAKMSISQNTSNAASRISREDRDRQRNIGRVLLESAISMVDDSGLVAEPVALTDEICIARWSKSRSECIRDRVAELRALDPGADPNRLVAVAQSLIERELNISSETWDERSQRVLQRTLPDLCNEIATSGTVDASNPNTVVVEAKSRISKAEALELLRKPPDVGSEPICAQFKHWIGVNAGGAQQQIEDRIRSKHPRLDPVKIAQRAEEEIREIMAKQTSKWTQFFSDDKMVDLLRRYRDMNNATAREILEAYMDYKSRIESTTDEERRNRENDNVLRNLERDESAARDAEYRQRVHGLIEAGAGRVPAGDPDFVPVDAARDPLTQPARTKLDPVTGAVTKFNGVDDALGPRMQSAAEFLYAFSRNKSDPDTVIHQRLCERIACSVHQDIQLHLDFMRVAKPSSLFADDENKPSASGNTVDDLIALLESTETLQRVDGDAVVRYLVEWQRCLVECRLDVDDAVAFRHKQYDADLVASMMKDLELSSEQVEANMAFGIDPETSEVMRQIIWAAQSDWFRQTDAQADERYKHAERIERLERRTKRRRVAEEHDSSGTSEPAAVAASHSQSRTCEDLVHSDDEAVADRGSDRDFQYSVESQFKDMTLHSRVARRMPAVPADYFPQFMRKGLGAEVGERDCRNGENCYCAVKSSIYPYADETKRRGRDFVCREFLLPAEFDAWRVNRKLPSARGFCLFCELYIITLEYDRLVRERKTPIKPLHRFAFQIGPGQFNASCMLPVRHEDRWTGIVRPFLRMNANNYVPGETRVGNVTVPCLRPTDRLDFRLTSVKRTRI